MKVTQEKLPASQVALKIEISAAASQQAYDDVVKTLSRTVRLPGFRPGKVPRQILLQRLGSQRVRAQALEKLIEDNLNRALEKVEPEALGNYQLMSKFDELLEQYQPGEPLEISASVDVPPEVDPGDYHSLSIAAEEVLYRPEEVDEFLERQRSRAATLVPVEGRPAQIGDVVVVDYKGYLQAESGDRGEAIAGAEASDFELELESGQFLEDLIEGIVGMAIGEEREITVCFPDDYAREDLAGQTALFQVKLSDLKEKELPELDDEFAEEVSEFATIAELREHLEKQYRERAEKATANNVETAISAWLREQVTIDLPKTLIDREIDRQVRQAMLEMERYGLDVGKMLQSDEVLAKVREEARPEAIRALTVSLSLGEIAKREALTLDVAEVDRRVQEIAEELGGDRQLDLKRVREFVEDDLRQDAAMAWLREQAAIELVPEGSLESEGDEDDEGDRGAEEALEPATATIDVSATEDIEPEAEAEPDIEPEAEAEAEPDIEPEAEAEAEPDIEPEAEAEPDIEPEAEAEPDAEAVEVPEVESSGSEPDSDEA